MAEENDVAANKLAEENQVTLLLINWQKRIK